MQVELRRKVIDERPSHYLLEWSPMRSVQDDKERRWYSLNYKRIQPSSFLEPFITAYRDLMNRILRGGTESVVGEYDRPEKQLVIEGVN